jgi:hypothetical protein
MKNKKIIQFLTFVGLAGVAVWLMTKGEKKSGFSLPDLEGGAKGQANAMTFTMQNTSPAATPQKINLFNASSLTPVTSQNPNVSISSTPDLQYFISTIQKEPKVLDRIDVRSTNPQQLLQSFNFQAKDANGKQVNINVLPMQSAMQVQSNIATADLDGYVLDGSTQITGYTVLGGAPVEMIVYWK